MAKTITKKKSKTPTLQKESKPKQRNLSAPKNQSAIKKTSSNKTVIKAKKTATPSQKSAAKAKSTVPPNPIDKKKAVKQTEPTVSIKKVKAKKPVSPSGASRSADSHNKKHTPAKKIIVRKSVEMEFPKVRWGSDSIISFEATTQLPPAELTSIAGGFAFHDDKLVLANVPGRGWEIIGGRIDIGEDPEITFRREAHKQIGVTFSEVKMIGVIRFEHTGPEPPNCPYPYPVGYGVQYIGIVNELIPFRGGENSLGRSLITQEGFKEHYFEWNEFIDAVFHYAHSEYKKWLKKINK